MSAFGCRLHEPRDPLAAVIVDPMATFDGIVIRTGARGWVAIACPHPGRPLSFDTISVDRAALVSIGIVPRMGMRLRCEFDRTANDGIGAFIVTGITP